MTKKQNKKIIVVLGAGRSGTSLMMQILKKLGLSLSQNIIPAKAHNTLGTMEDAELAKVYDDLLLQIGSTRFLPISLDRLSDDLKSHIQSKLINIMKNNMNASESIWGFKDPFTSYLLPLWYRIFNSTDTVPVFILVVRNPAQSILSRKKHFGTLESIGELAWLVNYTEALHHSAADCYIAHYEDWFIRGEEMAEELLEYTGLDPFFQGKNVAEALQGVVKENLNRSIYEDYEVQNEYLLKLYESLKQCRGKDFNRVKLMQTVKACRKAMHSFRGWYEHAQTLQSREGKLAEKAKRHADLERELSKFQSDLDTKQKKIKELTSKSQSDLDTKQKKIKELTSKFQSDLDTKQKKIKELNADLEDMVLDNNRLLIENKDLFEIAENYRKRESKKLQPIQNWNREAIELKNSTSYRLGRIFIDAFREPGKRTLLIPYYLVELAWDIVIRRGKSNDEKAHRNNSR
jgi:hypothetical protein